MKTIAYGFMGTMVLVGSYLVGMYAPERIVFGALIFLLLYRTDRLEDQLAALKKGGTTHEE